MTRRPLLILAATAIAFSLAQPLPVLASSKSNGLSEAAFARLWSEYEPLSTHQIHVLAQKKIQMDEARERRTPPHSSTVTIQATLTPGTTPPVVKLSNGYATALSFLDDTGAPWPVESVTVGDESQFRVEFPKKPGNVVIISPTHYLSQSNLIVLLKGASVPLTLSLQSSRHASYYDADVTLDQSGPNARSPKSVPMPAVADNSVMRAILDGAGPVTQGVKQLTIHGAAHTTAFLAHGHLYLRTPYTVLSPGWIAVTRSPNESVYQMPLVSPITLADNAGNTLNVSLPEQAILGQAISGSEQGQTNGSSGN